MHVWRTRNALSCRDPLQFDVTTGLRFHPVEIILSIIKFGAVAALGTPAVGVLLFEVLLNATSMFNHGNVRLPEWLDRSLRWIVVTPEMQPLRGHDGSYPLGGQSDRP